jgi:predicted ATP-dependent serine protease
LVDAVGGVRISQPAADLAVLLAIHALERTDQAIETVRGL